jgi:hypothetical protein
MVTALTLALLAIAASGGDRVCELPADVGPCDGACPRWFFNADSDLCETFSYGCCEGNANNFTTLLQCQASCACELPMDPGPCEGLCPRWYYNASTGRCEEFTWGCCEGNANNFETRADCEAACDRRCAPDVTIDGIVNTDDLIAVIVAWGLSGGTVDVDLDGVVDVDDLVAVVLAWGPCG